MKKFLMALAAVVCVSGVALAGPNANGTIFLHDLGMVYTSDITDYCGLGSQPGSCQGADVQVDGTDQWVLGLYAAFPDGSSPRLKGIAFGLEYPAEIVVTVWAPCPLGSFEIPGTGWPGSGTGTSVVFPEPFLTQMPQIGWFAAYNYYGTPALLSLGPDPSQGGFFGDDSVPPELDPIVGYGTMGFGTAGEPACPSQPEPGACCVGEVCTITLPGDCPGEFVGGPCDPNPCFVTPTGACCIGTVCVILSEADCIGQGGTYQGDDTGCDPNPCLPPNPVIEKSWGSIKANYR